MRKTRIRSVTQCVSVFILLCSMLSGRFSAPAQTVAQGHGVMVIGALTCDAPNVGCRSEIGAEFTVTTPDGTFVGSCTVQGDPDDTSNVEACIVELPFEITDGVYVTESPASVTPGYAPEENPIFWTFPDPVTRPSHDVVFMNWPTAGSTGTTPTSQENGSDTSTGTRDIALITRDPGDGHLIYDGCYILLEYGDEGCDENGDGQITYADVPLGNYTVHQTRTPSGYPAVADFRITVDDRYQQVPLGYVVRQASEQNTPGARKVSVVLVDSQTRAKVEPGICLQLTGGSEPACDDALVDGQIDFLDVPAGTYSIAVTALPSGWQIPSLPTLTVDADSDSLSNQFVYVEVVPGSATASSAGNASGGSSASNSGGGTTSTGTASGSERTWTAAVTVINCDADPLSEEESHCYGGAGIVVNFALASGEFLGSCTTGEPVVTPWGGPTISTCAVEGMPFNSEIIAMQDPATLPPGYAPRDETSAVTIGNTLQGGGDGTPFYFNNFPIESGTTGSIGTSGNSNPNASATLLMTFRACPEGFDPAVQDFFANCTIPLDAPDASQILWGGDGQGGMPIWQMQRQYDGAYIYTAGPMTMNVDLARLEPVLRNAYQVVGADEANDGIYRIHLVDGEVREVFVFYWYA